MWVSVIALKVLKVQLGDQARASIMTHHSSKIHFLKNCTAHSVCNKRFFIKRSRACPIPYGMTVSLLISY